MERVGFAACTIVAHNYLPQAKILANSFLEFHPDSTFYIVVVDRPIQARLVGSAGYKLVPITEIDMGEEGFTYMASIYDVTEFATSVKPFVLRHLLENHDCVFYIDPDIKVFAPLSPLVERTLEAGWSLTPHSLQPIIRNGWQPTEQEIKGAGIYNLGFIGVTKKAVEMLDWWGERLRRDCIIDVSNQLFTDQRWIDMAVSLFPAYIERTTSYNVAYWNLDQRRVWKDGSTYMVDEDVLRFFHFSGYDPLNPHWISKYQLGRPRVLLSDNPVVAELCNDYGQLMLEIRDEINDSGPYGWRDIVPGLAWTKDLRRYLRNELMDAELEGKELPPNPYQPDGARKFVEWLYEISPIRPTKLPRYLDAIYLNRGDLQTFFPEVSQGDHSRFDGWVKRSGVVECASIVSLGDQIPKASKNDLEVKSVSKLNHGIDVYGYLNAELGVGEAGRLAARSLRSVNVPLSTISDHGTLSREQYEFETDDVGRFATILIGVNADQLPVVRKKLGHKFLQGRYVIGQWFWELEEFPKQWMDSFHMVDELWAPTQFIEACLKAKAPPHVKIRHMPLPLVTPKINQSVTRESLSLADGFMFLLTFDFMSVLKRKNAIGVVDAYCKAFPKIGETMLVIKTINGDKRLQELEKLRWHIRHRTDIVIIDKYMDSADSAALMNLSDCFVSLHRSEGLGLTMAEAMLLGKPVIATEYSGNMDFMSRETSYLVPWKYVKVGMNAEGYPAECMWAEPDLEVAANHMMSVYRDRDQARAIGIAARADLLERFSPEVCGQRMKNRLTEIWRTRNGS